MSFNIDANGILDVTAEDIRTGNTGSVTITNTRGIQSTLIRVRAVAYIHVTWLGLLTTVSRLSLLHHSRYSVVPSVAITFGHEPAA